MSDLISVLAGVVQRTRQHHAIEHATLHMLSARFPQHSFAGYSDPQGFTVYGQVEAHELRRAVGDALLRLQAGEQRLAIHPNCGTNVVVSALVATMGALLGTRERQSLWLRFPTVLTLIMVGLVAGRPLGMYLQRYTTQSKVADRWVAGIHPVANGRVHRVVFE